MNKRLFVAGLPFSTTSDELRTLFADFGVVISATVIEDRESGRSKGFGFVEMDKPEEAVLAISKLNDKDFGGRKLIIQEARPKEEKQKKFGYRSGAGGGFGKQRRSFGKRREGGRGNFGRGGGDSRRSRYS